MLLNIIRFMNINYIVITTEYNEDPDCRVFGVYLGLSKLKTIADEEKY